MSLIFLIIYFLINNRALASNNVEIEFLAEFKNNF